jgi:hypothetical protein
VPLIERVRRAIRARHYSRRTEDAYVQWINRYIVHHGKRHPLDMGRDDVIAFLTALAVDRRMSAWPLAAARLQLPLDPGREKW